MDRLTIIFGGNNQMGLAAKTTRMKRPERIIGIHGASNTDELAQERRPARIIGIHGASNTGEPARERNDLQDRKQEDRTARTNDQTSEGLRQSLRGHLGKSRP